VLAVLTQEAIVACGGVEGLMAAAATVQMGGAVGGAATAKAAGALAAEARATLDNLGVLANGFVADGW